jgi:hypothetical protein
VSPVPVGEPGDVPFHVREMIVLLTSSIPLAVAHGGPALGPKDGAGLPPTEGGAGEMEGPPLA